MAEMKKNIASEARGGTILGSRQQGEWGMEERKGGLCRLCFRKKSAVDNKKSTMATNPVS